MPTKRSASSSSRPRPNCDAYSSARSRLSSPARIESASTADSSRRTSGAEVAAGDVRAERQRQARLGEPPLAEVDHLLQAGRAVGQLALVDQEPGVGLAGRDLVHDLVERHLAPGELAESQPQREERRRHPARHGDLDAGAARPRSAARGRRRSARSRSPCSPRAGAGRTGPGRTGTRGARSPSPRAGPRAPTRSASGCHAGRARTRSRARRPRPRRGPRT